MIDFIPIDYYVPIYYWLMTFLCLCTSYYYMNQDGCKKLLVQNSGTSAIILSTILVVYIGLRPISGRYFVDMVMYAHGFNLRSGVFEGSLFDLRHEWFWRFIEQNCKGYIGDVHIWFLIISIFYFFCHLWASKRLLQENTWLSVLFLFFSYQFFNYGVNGMRNGVACAIMMVAISFFCDKTKKGNFIGIFLFLLAMGCHRSIMIPFAALIVSKYFIKDTSKAIWIWLLCIPISLVFGNSIVSLFAGLGFDDRMDQYSNIGTTRFSHSGFRWDFLLYSAMPIILVWYINRKKIKDETFTFLSNIYIIANSFWVLICRIAFSNRFAYLSWFLYSLVIAYAVIRIPIWKNQDRKAGLILAAHTMFTIGMYLLGK